MANNVYAIKYLGTLRVEPNTTYTTANILTEFPGATVAKLFTDKDETWKPNTYLDYIGITIDDSPMINFKDGEEQYIETGQTFKFNKACSIAIGTYKVVN